MAVDAFELALGQRARGMRPEDRMMMELGFGGSLSKPDRKCCSTSSLRCS